MSWVVWITGLPGSGKSTVALALREIIPDAVILRTDDLRKIMTPQPDYSEQERDYLYRAFVYMGKTLSELGHNVILDATGHKSSWRSLAEKLIPDFYEIYLECPLPVCEKRERTRIDTHSAPVDIYKKGHKGQPVPGINVAYEMSEKPSLIINTKTVSPDDAAKKISDLLQHKYRT